MLKVSLKLLLAGLLLLPSPAFSAAEHLRLATTTSTENSGLLHVLLPPFEESCACRVDVLAVGTGKAIKLGEQGDVDVILVHARDREKRFVAAGFGIDRRDVMYNDFVLLGPNNDPEGIGRMNDINAVMQKLATGKASFISRGDESGTHTREKRLWQAAGVKPSGAWYLEAGRGMGEVLIMADQKRSYTLSDRGTYLAFKSAVDLQVVFAGDRSLFNPYGVIMVNPQRHPHVKAALARKFIDYLTSPEAKKRIEDYRLSGEQLFYVEGK